MPHVPGRQLRGTRTSARLALHPRSAQIIAQIQADGLDNLHPDFGENPGYGIPYVVVPANQPLVPITYTAYGDESDPGPFPIPLDAPVEGAGAGGDRHVLVLRQGSCDLFELFVGIRNGSGWNAASGARFDLTSNDLRPLGWTSADAAGLPILPGLVRYDEVAAGVIRHAIRVTFSETQDGYILPATHSASDSTEPEPSADGTAVAAEGVVRRVAAHRSGAGDRGGDAAVRPDRRRQRIELVLPGRPEPELGRRRPEPAEGRPWLGVRGRRHRTGPVVTTTLYDHMSVSS